MSQDATPQDQAAVTPAPIPGVITVTKDFRSKPGVPKRTSIVVPNVPTPGHFDGIVAILQGDNQKSQELLFSVVQETIAEYAKELLTENPNLAIDDKFYASITWETIANIPPAQRAARGIPEEVWNAFFASYISEMQTIAADQNGPYPKERLEKHCEVYKGRFGAVKIRANKASLTFLQSFLTRYLTESPNAEQYLRCLELLVNKSQEYIDALSQTEKSNDL